ncbi:hypothetical protein [Mycobacterium sp.]|uniref:hypothetical protein n=1 Tax=Mycobacterium sp. TaxID=1785 RepID=UPI0025DB44D4|nr:hypothetical protein [Mycobacterium sp.]
MSLILDLLEAFGRLRQCVPGRHPARHGAQEVRVALPSQSTPAQAASIADIDARLDRLLASRFVTTIGFHLFAVGFDPEGQAVQTSAYRRQGAGEIGQASAQAIDGASTGHRLRAKVLLAPVLHATWRDTLLN